MPTRPRLNGGRLPTADLKTIIRTVRKNRLLIFRLDDDDYAAFDERSASARPFAMAVTPDIIADVRVPTICLVFGKSFQLPELDEGHLGGRIGVLAGKRHLTAIEFGIKIGHTLPIDPPSLKALGALIRNKRLANDLNRRLARESRVVALPPVLATQLITALGVRPKNQQVLINVAKLLNARGSPASELHRVQRDAIQSALEIFGLSSDARPLSLNATGDTILSSYWLREDSVIEHDARNVPGLQLTQTDVTGRAQFRRRDEILEVITANRRPLERALGVDLIYHNVVQTSLVMVQYKMLGRQPKQRTPGVIPDWIYRPNADLLKREIPRMKRFQASLPRGPGEYRLNPGMFYLKFVKRDKIGTSAAMTIPLEHFEHLRGRSKSKGPRGALRISYKSLSGAYLRDAPFIGLVRAGYIGSYATTTNVLLPLIRTLLRGDRAVVVAIQDLVP